MDEDKNYWSVSYHCQRKKLGTDGSGVRHSRGGASHSLSGKSGYNKGTDGRGGNFAKIKGSHPYDFKNNSSEHFKEPSIKNN